MGDPLLQQRAINNAIANARKLTGLVQRRDGSNAQEIANSASIIESALELLPDSPQRTNALHALEAFRAAPVGSLDRSVSNLNTVVQELKQVGGRRRTTRKRARTHRRRRV